MTSSVSYGCLNDPWHPLIGKLQAPEASSCISQASGIACSFLCTSRLVRRCLRVCKKTIRACSARHPHWQGPVLSGEEKDGCLLVMSEAMTAVQERCQCSSTCTCADNQSYRQGTRDAISIVDQLACKGCQLLPSWGCIRRRRTCRLCLPRFPEDISVLTLKIEIGISKRHGRPSTASLAGNGGVLGNVKILGSSWKEL